MKDKLPLTLAAALVAALAVGAPARAAGTVEVKFVEPEKFSDIGRYVFDRERAMDSLGEFMRSLGKELPDGETLKLDVLDVDLAGTIEPMRSNEVRIIRDRADWPRMKLRYTLLEGSTTLKSGTADLADMNYMQGLRGAGLIDGAFGYEKRMVQQWFRQKLLAH